MRFNDKGYLDAYYETGKFPEIHDDIFKMRKYVETNVNIIDLGCCYGLLAKRLSMEFPNVIGIESNKNYIANAIKGDNIRYYNFKVDLDTIGRLQDVIKENDVKGVFARRVLPELYETNGMPLVEKVIEAFYMSGIDFIVIEGRKTTKNARNALCSVEREIKAAEKFFDLKRIYRECAVLKRRDSGE